MHSDKRSTEVKKPELNTTKDWGTCNILVKGSLLFAICLKVQHCCETRNIRGTLLHLTFFFFIIYLKLYFIGYAVTVVLIVPLCHPPQSTPHSLRKSPRRCSCPWVMRISSLVAPFPVLYFTSPRLFYNYLFVLLNPLTTSTIPPHPLPSDNHQNILHIHDVVSGLLVCLVWFLDSIVYRYVFLTFYCS